MTSDTAGEVLATTSVDVVKRFYGALTTPVAIVTAFGPNQAPYGTTISSYCTISLSPPIFIISLLPSSDLLSVLSEDSTVRVHFPSREHTQLAQRFAGKGGPAKFDDVDWSDEGEAPAFTDLPWMLGRIGGISIVGDHHMVQVDVDEVRHLEIEPLLYRARSFGSFKGEKL